MTIKSRSVDFVFINARDCLAFGLPPGTSAMTGAWLQIYGSKC